LLVLAPQRACAAGALESRCACGEWSAIERTPGPVRGGRLVSHRETAIARFEHAPSGLARRLQWCDLFVVDDCGRAS